MTRKKEIIRVPDKIKYLSDFPEMDSLLDRGKVILNKQVTGCGATEYYLRSPQLPVILISPRKMLIETKMDLNPTEYEIQSGIHVSEKRHLPVHYFDRSNGDNYEESRESLLRYLANPYGITDYIHKILVTYDSFANVKDILGNEVNKFTIVMDEFPTIFKDVFLKGKGTKILRLTNELERMSNHIVFLSATPLKDQYIDSIPMLQGVPYYTLEWDPSMVQKIRVNTERIGSITEKMKEIVADYNTKGCFKATYEKGGIKYSREGVFFLNSVNDIVKVIESCNLQSKDVLVLCSPTLENERKLKKISPSQGRFSIGRPASIYDYQTKNKPFTFVTSVGFEGADMYSDNSSVYVFSNGNRDSLNLDASIDLQQIAGRCRNPQPFKDDINLFYITSIDKVITTAKDMLKEKELKTREMLKDYSGIDNLTSLQPILDAQKSLCYKTYYLDVLDLGNGKGKVVMNETAHQADIRAIDIREEQYASNYTMSCFVDNEAQKRLVNEEDRVIYDFFCKYRDCNDFPTRMFLYVEMIREHPDLKEVVEEKLTFVDIKYKNYYNILGAEEIIRCRCREDEITRKINGVTAFSCTKDMIAQRLCAELPKGKRISKKECKKLLQSIFDEYSVPAKAKSTDLSKYGILTKNVKMDINGKRQDGYEIL